MNKKTVFAFLLGLIPMLNPAQNVNLSNYAFFDAEPFIAVNPTNPNNVIAAWIKITTFTTSQIAVVHSTDGGVTWSSPQNMPHVSPTYTSADPSIDFNSSGKAFLTYVDYKQTLDSGKVVLVSSTDGGQSWSGAMPVTDGLETADLPVDRPWVGVDRSGGMYDGRIYVTTINVETGFTTNHVYMKYSSDDGVSWSPLIVIDDSIPADLVRTGNSMAIAADGSVNLAYISWHIPASFAARVIMVKSTDGGQTFTPYVAGNVPANSAINDTLQASSTLSANPVNPQNLILTFTSNVNGDADILAINSMNGGITWGFANPVRINDDALSNGNQQDMSWACFAPDGTYIAAWRDRRNSGTSVTSPFEIWMCSSVNGGVSFGTNYLVSSVLSPDIAIQRGNDFIGITASSIYVHNSWCDFRTGNTDIFYNRDSLAAVLNVEERPDEKPVVTVFPNPVTSAVTFRYHLPANQQNSTIEITDINGKSVKTIFKGTQSAGHHEVVVDVTDFAEGVYFFRITGDKWEMSTEFIKTK